MVTDYLIDNETQEFLAEFGIKIGVCRQRAQSLNLLCLSRGIGRGKRCFRLILPYGLRDAEPLCQDMDQRRVDIVNAAAKGGELSVSCRIGHEIALSVGWARQLVGCIAQCGRNARLPTPADFPI